MEIKYLEDLHIPKLGDWSSEAAGDWIHPSHGPLPDHLGLLECVGKEYMVALWETGHSLYVAVELLEDEDPDPLVPALDEATVYATRGWFVQTYHWGITLVEIVHGCHVITPGPFRNHPEWRKEIYREVMEKSVLICNCFPEE
jgi:hypothetical protein